MKKVVFFILELVIFAQGCNNYCSGHGTCEAKDQCKCFPGFGGADCSLRACPYSEAYVDLPLGDLNHDGKVTETKVKTEWYPEYGLNENPFENVKSRAHRYAECSNAGICNRETGLCECFDGFVGSACQRRACPTSVPNTMCSGHGVCMSSETYMLLTDNNFRNSKPGTYGWEYEKFYTCLCDKGYNGISCNSRECPMGVDPVDSAQPILYWNFILNEDIGNTTEKGSLDHYYVLEYDGVTYKSAVAYKHTKLCTTNKDTDLANMSGLKEEIRRVITVIPPLAQVTVSAECTDDGLLITLTPEYLDAKKMEESTLYVYKSDSFGNPLYTSAIKDGEGKAGSSSTEKSISPKTVIPAPMKDTIVEALCSNRGRCNRDNGLCECFEGYSGAACQITRNK